MAATNATTLLRALPTELEKKLSLVEALRLDLELPCLQPGESPEPSSSSSSSTMSETNTLNERHDSSMTSPRTSICSSNTSNCSTSNITVVKPVKRVRFEESVSCSFFEENLEHLSRPPMQRKNSFISRSWDRITPKNSSTDSNMSATPSSNNPYSIQRHSISVDLLDAPSKPLRRPTLPDRAQSYTIQQPLRESAGRRYSGTETMACFRSKPATTKGNWGDLLGSRAT